jgi:hypothetical protein
MNELIAFVRDCNGPTAAMPAFMQKATAEFRRDLVGCSLSRCRVGEIHPFLVTDEPILGVQVEIVAGHRHPLWFMAQSGVRLNSTTARCGFLFEERARFF